MARRIFALTFSIETQRFISFSRELLSGSQVESIDQQITLFSGLADLKFALLLGIAHVVVDDDVGLSSIRISAALVPQHLQRLGILLDDDLINW